MKSGIRERLFLLSVLVKSKEELSKYPKGFDDWEYDPHFDCWSGKNSRIEVRREGVASLDILSAIGVSRTDAMKAIGYPEGK